MPINIGSNIASLRAQRQLNKSSAELDIVFERLSSGMRINRASDDAAGLAISASLNSDRRVFAQGIRNFNDGVSLLNIADSAIEQLSSIVIRLKELSSQAANGVLGTKQRESIDNEAQALSKEYLRIARSTEFNNLKILNGNSGDIRLQGGYGTDGSINSNIGGALGTGEFYASSFIELSSFSGIENFAYSDLNGDGIGDVVAVGGAGVNGHLAVLLGNADGTFSIKSTENNGGSYTKSVVLGDVNGDGIMDLLTAHQPTFPTPSPWVTIRLGNGDGTFRSGTTYSSEESVTERIQLVDLNGDGMLDLFTLGANYAGTGAHLRLGTGNGTFGASISINVGDSADDLKIGDVNNDGIMDLVSTGTNQLNVILGQTGGNFSGPVSYSIPDFSGNHVALNDVNGDGNLDILLALTDDNSSEAYAGVYLGSGDGTFGTSTSYLMGDYPLPTQFADFNGDGNIDIIHVGIDLSFNDTINVRLGDGKGTFGEVITSLNTAVGFYNAAEMVDYNRDGVLDVIAIGQNLSSAQGIFIRAAKTQSGVSALLSFSLKTRADALQAMPLFEQKLNQLTAQSGSIGAFQSRLSVGINNLHSAAENYAAAASRITDIDAAEESARLVRLNILQQAASGVLAQANQQPALAIKLLSSESKIK